MEEWISACKGDKKTSCDFDYAGTMSVFLLAETSKQELEVRPVIESREPAGKPGTLPRQ